MKSGFSLSLFFGHHDSSVTVADDKQILLHLEAERFFREKHCRIKTLEKMEVLVAGALNYLGLNIFQIDYLYLSTLSNPIPPGKIKLNGRLMEPIVTTHHNSHIGTVLHHGFKDAIIVVADGGSEDGSTKIYFHNTNGEISLIDDLGETAANGKFYGSLTMMVIEPDFLKAHGWYSGKTMGLSAFGNYQQEFEQKLKKYTPEMLWGYILDMEKSRNFFELSNDYDKPWLDKRRIDLARTGQQYWVNCFLEKLSKHKHLSGNIVMVGGCALNVLLNSALLESGLFKKMYIGPAPGDCGQSIGSIIFDQPQIKCEGAYLGRGFGEVEQYPDKIEEDLLQGKLVAWYQGKSEIGPRALGHRSYLGLPTTIEQKDRMNLLKGREPYRPVAPIIIAEEASNFFAIDYPSPYMSFAPKVKEITRKLAPAIVHADGTSRLQTIDKEDNPVLHRLLTAIGNHTGIPLLMNTSFNIAGEAMVDTPEDALKSFAKSGFDILYLNGKKITK